MALKTFFKPTKGKIIALFILMIYSSFYAFQDYEGRFEIYNGLTGVQIAKMFYTGPGWAVYTLVTDKKTYDEECNTPNETGMPFPCEFASINIIPYFVINPALGISLVLLSNLIYWYLIICIFGWLHSLGKKPSPQGSTAQP